jgi:hemolysin activation/secretion protein
MTRAGVAPVRTTCGLQPRFAVTATALLCATPWCYAQTPTQIPNDANAVKAFGQARESTTTPILRDVEERQKALPRTPSGIDIQDQRRGVKPVPGLKIEVKAFRFSGLTVVRESDLQAEVKSFIGPDKSFDDLQSAVDAVSEHLQRKGYVVGQAFLPEQKIENGIVEIAVLEGRLGRVRVDMEPDVPVSRRMIEGLLSPLKPGTILHRDVVERSLFLVSDLRGLTVRSIVEPGGSPGTSDIVLKIAATRRVDGTAEFDNHVSRFTGDYRLGGSINFNSPLKRGDLLSFRGLLGLPGGNRDLDFGRVSYLTPVGNYGTKVGVAYLRLNYHIGTGLFDLLDLGGRSEVVSGFALHPIVRTRNFNLFGQASFDVRYFEDVAAAAGTGSQRRTHVGGFSLVGDTRDAHLRGGINNFSLGVTQGDLDLRSANVFAADQAPTTGLRTAGGYTRINFSASRLNTLAENTVAYFSYGYQWASKNLDASEKIGLGGPTAVRAYAIGEATSDEAHLFTAEVRTNLPQPGFMPGNLVGLAFFDWAHGRLNKNPLPPQTPSNIRTLSGVGVGVTWTKTDDFLVRGTLAWRLTGNPISEPDDKKPRLFFQLQKNL